MSGQQAAVYSGARRGWETVVKGLVKAADLCPCQELTSPGSLTLCCPLNEMIPSFYSPTRWTARRSLHFSVTVPSRRLGLSVWHLANHFNTCKRQAFGRRFGCCGPGPVLARHREWAPREWVPTGSHTLESMVLHMTARFLGTCELIVRTIKLDTQIHTFDRKKPHVTVNQTDATWLGLRRQVGGTLCLRLQEAGTDQCSSKAPMAHRGSLPLPAHPPFLLSPSPGTVPAGNRVGRRPWGE